MERVLKINMGLEEDFIVTRLSSGEKVDLRKLNIDELHRLHYEEETYAACILKSMPPFSSERNDFLEKSYDVVGRIMNYEEKLDLLSQVDNGDKIFLSNIVKKSVKKCFPREKSSLKVLELGCGNCKFLNEIANVEKLEIYGCDLHPGVEYAENITIYKKDILSTLLSFENETIDILIADNVCEHFFEDEASTIYSTIYNKLSKIGRAIFVIPNSMIGPNDISKYYLQPGEKAAGFHFMEKTYKENIAMFTQYSLRTEYCCLKVSRHTPILVYNCFGVPDWLKVRTEKMFSRLPVSGRMKKILFTGFGYAYYILKKM